MCEPLLTHQVVSSEGRLNVVLVNADGAPHEHVLRPLSNLPVDPQQVRLLQCFVPEEVVRKIAVVVNALVDRVSVCADDAVGLVAKQLSVAALLVFEVVK